MPWNKCTLRAVFNKRYGSANICFKTLEIDTTYHRTTAHTCKFQMSFLNSSVHYYVQFCDSYKWWTKLVFVGVFVWVDHGIHMILIKEHPDVQWTHDWTRSKSVETRLIRNNSNLIPL